MERRIQIKLSTRFYTHGNPEAKNLLVVLHGYGQLASYFIEKFKFLDPENYFVVAPEGLHRFYLNGTNGRVGASWMTKEDRENDIQNYVHYLDELLSVIIKENNYSTKILLGFSQGGATASRYVAMGKIKFNVFILWAAIFPPDMQDVLLSGFNFSKNFFVIGTQDKYYSEELIVKEVNKLNEIGLKFEIIKFVGNHTIDSDTLTKLLHEI